MTPEDQQYFEKQLDMFLHPGWQYFIGQIQGMLEATDTLSGATRDNVDFKKGEVSIMKWVLDWPEQIRKAYDEQQAKDDADL